LLSARALAYNPYRQIWEKRLLRYLSWQWRTRAQGGNYGQVYRADTLLEAIGESVVPRRASWQKARLEKALDTIQTDRGIAAWQYQELNVNQWWRSTVPFEPPESFARRISVSVGMKPPPASLPRRPSESGSNADGWCSACRKSRRRAAWYLPGISQLDGTGAKTRLRSAASEDPDLAWGPTKSHNAAVLLLPSDFQSTHHDLVFS
jgi:hypothetical protein